MSKCLNMISVNLNIIRFIWHATLQISVTDSRLQRSKEKRDIYPRTKHGTISPFSILLSHEEHTPWWIGPSSSERDDYQASTLLVSVSLPLAGSNKPRVKKSGPNAFSQRWGRFTRTQPNGKLQWFNLYRAIVLTCWCVLWVQITHGPVKKKQNLMGIVAHGFKRCEYKASSWLDR